MRDFGLLFHKDKMMSYYMSAWIYVIFGSLAIALGGYLTTKGWNQFNNHYEKTSLITGALREWKENEKYLKLMDEYSLRINTFSQPILLSTFHYDALQNVLTSHHFKPEEEADTGLLSLVSGYLLNVRPVNDSITKINNIISSNIEPIKRKEEFGNFYSCPLFSRFREKHRLLGEELRILVHESISRSESGKPNVFDTGLHPDR